MNSDLDRNVAIFSIVFPTLLGAPVSATLVEPAVVEPAGCVSPDFRKAILATALGSSSSNSNLTNHDQPFHWKSFPTKQDSQTHTQESRQDKTESVSHFLITF